LLKDNADDIASAIHDYTVHPFASEVIAKLGAIAGRPQAVEVIGLEDLPSLADFVFIALHGRPGEDGALQAKLDTLGLPYNGSGVTSSQLTIDKFATNERFAKGGLHVASHQVIQSANYQGLAASESLCKTFGLPLIAKPIDDGCSSAVKKIRSAEELHAFAQAIFRENESEEIAPDFLEILKLKPKEEFPSKTAFLIEAYIGPEARSRLIEVTVGVMTHRDELGNLVYQVLEPSEAVVQEEVLSLEEKFLAGEGMNITPARFSANAEEQSQISSAVKAVIKEAACLAGVEVYARIDAFVRLFEDASQAPKVYLIEVNSLPGMTPATCIFHQAALAEMRPIDFIDRIIQEGVQRKASQPKLAVEEQIHG
jgi:D-alanine-D-alanine ligase